MCIPKLVCNYILESEIEAQKEEDKTFKCKFIILITILNKLFGVENCKIWDSGNPRRESCK